MTSEEQTIRSTINSILTYVPKYRKVAVEAFASSMMETVISLRNDNSNSKADNLKAKLGTYLRQMRDNDWESIPVELPRKPDENVIIHLDRCYDESGYFSPSQKLIDDVKIEERINRERKNECRSRNQNRR